MTRTAFVIIWRAGRWCRELRSSCCSGDGSWLRGVYEWRGNEVTWPGFRFRLGGTLVDTNPTPSMVAAIHPSAVLRWPL